MKVYVYLESSCGVNKNEFCDRGEAAAYIARNIAESPELEGSFTVIEGEELYVNIVRVIQGVKLEG